MRYKMRFSAFVAFLASAIMLNASIKEGIDYIVLKEPIPNAQNSVIEVFNYSCPFCYKYSKILPQIIKSLPKNTAFIPYHMEQKGDYGRLASELFAVLIIKDKKSGTAINDEKNSSFKRAEHRYFEEYHLKKNRWNEGKDAFLKTGLDAANISLEEFQRELQSTEVQALLKDWQKAYDIALIQGIPAFVINGKYLIKTNELKSLDDLKDKIRKLLAL